MENVNLGVIQFSGQKPLEGSYTPGSMGNTGTKTQSGELILHWKWILEPTENFNLPSNFVNHDTLDGNSQLWLCLQDCALPGVLNRGNLFKAGNKKQIIVITDEEWDIKKLKGPNGEITTRDEVRKLVHIAGYEVHAIIVRPNRNKDLNEDVIQKLTVSRERYHKVYTDNFDEEISKAMRTIANKIKNH